MSPMPTNSPRLSRKAKAAPTLLAAVALISVAACSKPSMPAGASNGGAGPTAGSNFCLYDFPMSSDSAAVSSTLAALSGNWQSEGSGFAAERAADGSDIYSKNGFSMVNDQKKYIDLKFLYRSQTDAAAYDTQQTVDFKYSDVVVAAPSTRQGFAGYVVLMFRNLSETKFANMACYVTAMRPLPAAGTTLAAEIEVLGSEMSTASGDTPQKAADAYFDDKPADMSPQRYSQL